MATDLTSTGLRDQAHFTLIRRLWERSYWDYVQARVAALQKTDPAVDWWNTAVDVSDMPRFQYKEEDLASRLKGVLLPLGILMAMAVAAFGAAYVSFVKYDVR